MGTNVVICAGPNHLGTRYSQWVAGSEYSASFPDGNLASSRPSRLWRSLTQNPYQCKLSGNHNVFAYYFGSYADSFALIGHNLRRGSGRWRVRAFGGDSYSLPLPMPLYIPPNASSSPVSVTGGYANVDDDLSLAADDGAEILPSGGGWSIILSFPNAASDLVDSSDGRQVFIVKVRKSGSADVDAASANWPTIKAELYQGGSLVRDLGTKPVYSISDRYYFFEWDASELSSLAGTNVQLRLSGDSGSGEVAKVRAAGWWQEPATYSEIVSSTGGLIADSGWLDAIDDLESTNPFGAFYPVRAFRSETSFHRFSTVGYSGDPVGALTRKVSYLQILLMDDHCPTVANGSLIGRTPIASDGYLEAGIGWQSRGLELTINRELGDLVTVDDRSIRTETYGGNLGGARLPRRRIISIPLEWCTEAEGMALLDRLAWEGSILDGVVVSLRPTSETERRHTTIYGVLMDPQTILRATNNGATYNRGLTLRFLEWR